jgi:hypothetical protein
MESKSVGIFGVSNKDFELKALEFLFLTVRDYIGMIYH